MKKIFLFTVICIFSISVFSQEYGLSKGQSIGNEINTEEHGEYSPTISADGNTLIYESNSSGIWKLYITYKTTNGWTEPELLDNVNSKDDAFDGGPFITYDNNFLIITSDRSGGLGYTDIWISERLGDKWSEPTNIGSPINTVGYDGFASMTSDGNEIYFMRMETEDGTCTSSSNYSLFWSKKVNGKWIEPEKLPYPINSDDCEYMGRILPDNKTLIFSSIRDGGNGEFDLYKSEKLPDGNWSSPINLGSFINSDENDLLVSIPASGDIMYYNTGESDYTDIYSVQIPKNMQPEAVFSITGFVYDMKNQNPLCAEIKITNLDDPKDNYTIKSNQKDGKFSVNLVQTKNYEMEVYAPQYDVYKATYMLKNKQFNEPKIMNIYLGQKTGKAKNGNDE